MELAPIFLTLGGLFLAGLAADLLARRSGIREIGSGIVGIGNGQFRSDHIEPDRRVFR